MISGTTILKLFSTSDKNVSTKMPQIMEGNAEIRFLLFCAYLSHLSLYRYVWFSAVHSTAFMDSFRNYSQSEVLVVSIYFSKLSKQTSSDIFLLFTSSSLVPSTKFCSHVFFLLCLNCFFLNFFLFCDFILFIFSYWRK